MTLEPRTSKEQEWERGGVLGYWLEGNVCTLMTAGCREGLLVPSELPTHFPLRSRGLCSQDGKGKNNDSDGETMGGPGS